MPNIHLLEHKGLVFWKIEESILELLELTDLCQEEKTLFNKISSEKRQKEFLACRALLKSIHPNYHILYTKEGKPFIKDDENFHLSISHSEGLVGLLLSQNEIVGLDIQKVKEKISRIKHKFVSKKEELLLNTYNPLFFYTLIWSCKECIYKMLYDKHLSFLDDIEVYEIKKSEVAVQAEGKMYYLSYYIKENNVIVAGN